MNKPKIKALGSFLSFLVITLVTSSCTPSTVKQNSAAQVTSKPTQEVAQKTQESDTLSVPVVLAARFKIKPEKRELFLQLATATLEPTRAEAGSISYSFYEEANVPNSFIYFEEWKSREALAKHLEKSYVKNLVDKFPEMLDGELDVKVYDVDRLTKGLEVDQ